MAKWVFAMDGFYKVNKIVKPKKEQLAVAEAEYADVMKVLSVKQAELKKIVDKVNALKADLKATQDKKAELEALEAFAAWAELELNAEEISRALIKTKFQLWKKDR